MTPEEIKVMPFGWNDNLSEIAQEDFSLIQKSLSYGTATTIGMALAKLELLEHPGATGERTLTLVTEHGTVVRTVFDPAGDKIGYTSHFATCPNANKHRRK